MPRAMPVILGLVQAEQRPSSFRYGLQPQIEPGLHRFARRAVEAIVGNDADARVQHVVGRDQFCNRVAGPADYAVGGQHELIVGGGGQFLGAGVDLAGQRLLRGGLQGLGVGAGFRRIWSKGESVEPANHMAFNYYFAGLADFRIQNAVLPQAAHQYTGTPVNETLREPFM